MSLIKISDFKFGKKEINPDSWVLKSALLRLKNKKKIKESSFENVIDMGELILTMNKILRLTEKRCGNTNAKRTSNE